MPFGTSISNVEAYPVDVNAQYEMNAQDPSIFNENTDFLSDVCDLFIIKLHVYKKRHLMCQNDNTIEIIK